MDGRCHGRINKNISDTRLQSLQSPASAWTHQHWRSQRDITGRQEAEGSTADEFVLIWLQLLILYSSVVFNKFWWAKCHWLVVLHSWCIINYCNLREREKSPRQHSDCKGVIQFKAHFEHGIKCQSGCCERKIIDHRATWINIPLWLCDLQKHRWARTHGDLMDAFSYCQDAALSATEK